MTGVSLTFFISSFGILGMIFLKFLELRTGKPSFMSKMFDKANHFVLPAYRKVRIFLSYFNKRNAVLFFRFVAYHIFIFARKIYLKLKTKLMSYKSAQKLKNMVQGKGALKKKGSVSFFLQRIAEEAQEVQEEVRQETAEVTIPIHELDTEKKTPAGVDSGV